VSGTPSGKAAAFGCAEFGSKIKLNKTKYHVTWTTK
jgi:hypothetical protein